MRIAFEDRLLQKSMVTYDVTDVATYGKYVLLFYQVPKGQEEEKTSSFRRRLSLGSVNFDSFMVKAWLRMVGNYPSIISRSDKPERHESDDLFVPESSQSSGTVSSSSQVLSSQTDSARSYRVPPGRSGFAAKSLFWIVMVGFETDVRGIERFSLSKEGYPFCFVKRDLNHPGREWIDMWQQWMRDVSVTGSQYGYPVVPGVNSKAGLARRRRVVKTGTKSQYFGGVGRQLVSKRVSPVPGAEASGGHGQSCDGRQQPGILEKSGFREQMLVHRVSQLESRVRSLEDLLARM